MAMMWRATTAAVEVRALGDDEVMEAKYYHPPGGIGGVDACSAITDRDAIIDPKFIRNLLFTNLMLPLSN